MKHILLTFIIILLASCGGNGGTHTPPEPIPVPDRSPPLPEDAESYEKIIELDDKLVTITFYKDLSYGPAAYDMALPERPTLKPVILLVHGGGWFRGSKEAGTKEGNSFGGMMEHFAAEGHVVVAINYTLGPHPSGFRDVLTAKDYFASQYGLPVIMVGASAGAHLVTLTAAASPENVLGVVSISGIYDLTADVGSGTIPTLVEKYLLEEDPMLASPIFYDIDFSLYMIHGIEDFIVYVSQCLAMGEKFGIECDVRDNEGHIITFFEYPELEEYIDRITLQYLLRSSY